MDIINLGEADGLPPVEWAGIAQRLEGGKPPAPEALNARSTWLSTVNDDGSPHVTAVGALWLDDTFWFQTGQGTRKNRNVTRDPRCSIAVSVPDADVVLQRLTRGLRGGDILLLHDGHAAHSSTGNAVILEVLPRLLDAVAAARLTPVTLRSALT